MHRRALLDLLGRYQPRGSHEGAALARIDAFVRAQPDCFERSLAIGHITGSAWLVNRAATHVLLTHHRKLDKWLQLGGHADGDPDILAVALREAREESGIGEIVPVSPDVFDVDVHPIPERAGEPPHDHYDIRFLLTVSDSEETQISDESNELRWFTAHEMTRLDLDESMLRIQAKWLRIHRTTAVT